MKHTVYFVQANACLMLTSFKNHVNQGEALYLLLSNFTLDDPKQSGGTETKCIPDFC